MRPNEASPKILCERHLTAVASTHSDPDAHVAPTRERPAWVPRVPLAIAATGGRSGQADAASNVRHEASALSRPQPPRCHHGAAEPARAHGLRSGLSKVSGKKGTAR
eukprot:5785694-Pleurochrysis_carterae.AAC.1